MINILEELKLWKINLSINKECFKEKTRTTFNHKKLTDFLNLYDKSKKNN